LPGRPTVEASEDLCEPEPKQFATNRAVAVAVAENLKISSQS
jgi:hypothetical protein